jgi:hypothetical protein
MPNHTPHLSRDALRRPAIAGLAIAALAVAPLSAAPSISHAFRTTGTVARVKPSKRPTIEAAFPRESYRPGAAARLVIFSKHVRGVRIQIFRAGTEPSRLKRRDEMLGTAVTPVRRLGALHRNQILRLRVPDSPSGVYFVKLIGNRGRIGYAPFVLRPRRLGESPVAIVMPTFTWQAYNFHDDDGDGRGDTWYNWRTRVARLGRPFENRGVPPYYKSYDQPFLRWVIQREKRVDYLAQTDVAKSNGRALAAAYDLLIFPGHHEYVTKREYDAVEGFRNRGGNLMFLSANNFFWKVVTRANMMYKVRLWRELGRPEASLIGVQYIGNDDGSTQAPWVVRDVESAPWLFEGMSVSNGDLISSAGIEIDKRAPSSPPGTRVIAELPDLLGPGRTGQMTYYERRGAKVFAAGAFSLARSVWDPDIDRMMANLWARLARP